MNKKVEVPTKWCRFSDYEICTSEDDTRYICPVPGSSALFYDPMAKPEKLAISILEAADSLRKYDNDETVVLDLVRSYGLTGYAFDQSEEYVFPFGGTPVPETEIKLSGRGPLYSVIFSVDYAEKVDDLISWLKEIDVSNKACEDFSTLKSIALYCISSLNEEGRLHTCANCGKLYYSEDPESETCSKACEFQYSVSDSVSGSKKRYIGHLIGGG